MTEVVDILCGVLILLGTGLSLLAAVGVLRFPDVYSRMHAATKAGTLGAGVVIAAMAIHDGQLDVVLRALAGIYFLIVTAPIAAHLLGRAAYSAGIPLWHKTAFDDLKDRYDDPRHGPRGADLSTRDYE